MITSDMYPSSTLDDGFNGLGVHAELFSKRVHRPAIAPKAANLQDDSIGQFCSRCTNATRVVFRWIREMVTSAFGHLVTHVIGVGAYPEMAETHVIDAIDDVDADIIVLGAAGRIAGMQHVKLIRGRNAGRERPCVTMGLDPLPIHHDAAVTDRVHRPVPGPTGVARSLLDAQPEPLFGRESGSQMTPSEKVVPRLDGRAAATATEGAGIINLHRGPTSVVPRGGMLTHRRPFVMPQFYPIQQRGAVR